MKAMSPNSELSASKAASTSCSSSVSPASIAARNTVPPASISRSTIAMSERSSAACSPRASRAALMLWLISRSRWRLRSCWAPGPWSSADIWARRARLSASSSRRPRVSAPIEESTPSRDPAPAPPAPAPARAGAKAAAHSNRSMAAPPPCRSSWRSLRTLRSSQLRIPAWRRSTSSKSPTRLPLHMRNTPRRTQPSRQRGFPCHALTGCDGSVPFRTEGRDLTQSGWLPGPAQDQQVAPGRQLDQAAAGPGRHRAERRSGAVAGDDAALGQQDLLRAQPALAVLEVDERQQRLPGAHRAGPVTRAVAVDDLAELSGNRRARHGARGPGVQVGDQGDRLLAVEGAGQAFP